MNISIKTEWLEAAKTLKNPFAFIEAIVSYMQTGEVPALEPDAKGMFVIIKAEIDRRSQTRDRVAKHRTALQERYSNDVVTKCNVTQNTKEKSPCTPLKENTKKTETKVSAKESQLSFEQLIPASLKTIEFEIAWDQWCKYRREIKQSITKSTAERQLNKLGRYPPAVAIAAIDQSITNGWSGLFPDKITIRLPAKDRDYTKL